MQYDKYWQTMWNMSSIVLIVIIIMLQIRIYLFIYLFIYSIHSFILGNWEYYINSKQ